MAKRRTDWKVLRLDLARKIIRLDLSPGAKLLWQELALNWCWNDPECCPTQDVLATALRAHANSVARWATELCKAGLMTRVKHYRGWWFTLATEIPAELLDDEWRFNNSALTRRVRGREDPTPESPPVTQCVDTHKKEEWENTEVKTDSPPVGGDTHIFGEWDQEIPTKIVGGYPQKRGVYLSTFKGREDEEFKADEGRRERPLETVALIDTEGKLEVGRIDEGRQADETLDQNKRTYMSEVMEPEDPSELMSDPEPKTQHPRRRSKRRGPSGDLVGLPGNGLRNASQPPDGAQTIEASPPAPEDPEDVLALLRGEIEAKYGAKACRPIPLALSGKEKSQVKNVILRKYEPGVVIAMIRVLVWDWEVARSSCFPYRPQVKIPTIEALVQYQETLASAVDSGLKYDGSNRGAWKTYATRYLVDANPSFSKDPF